ncbi:O-antigen ligase family protein [Alkalihalobacillus hwajinpoensis]|uniref:O-antigen ligase family protein n=1 Tax=Guptibacillus hwajinpoensis TaxID=208199 RepID=UPI001884659D|nr:O-antigen ligase family protein [Pseudalkalibacillus hwajinpoensis]MBF0705387.1 O-antigen ligase family protein [Pseudalkalibacillus hwajinpoensis]
MIYRNFNLVVFINKIAIFLIYTFPFIPLFNIGSRVIQVETLVFILVLISFTIELSRISFGDLSKDNIILLFVLWLFSLLTVISLFYTSEVILAQLQDLIYWLLSFSPLILIRSKLNGVPTYNYIRSIMFSSIVGSLIVILIKVSSDTVIRSTGFMSSSNLAGVLFALAAIISFGYYLEFKGKLALITFLINIVAILSTGSRESLITLVIAIVIIGLLLFIKSRKQVMRWVLLVIVIFVAGLFILNKLLPDILRRYLVTITSISSGNESEINFAFSDRIILWKELVNWIIENPLTPLGFQGLQITGTFGLYAHNMFLQSIVIGGLVGLIAFFLLIGIIYKYCLRVFLNQPSPISSSLLALLISYSLTGMVSDHFLNFFTWNFIMFIVLRQHVEKQNL